MTHFMIDIETTGLNPGVHGITSIAIVPFVFGEPEIVFRSFHQAFERTEARINDPETTKFRSTFGIDEAEKNLSRCAIITDTLSAIQTYIREKSDHNGTYVWAKPAHFDIAFLDSYYRMFNLKAPWSHRNIRDLATYLMAAGLDLQLMYKTVTFDGDLHNASYDAMYQIKLAQIAYLKLQDKLNPIHTYEQKLAEGI